MNIVFFDIDGTLATGTQVPASARKAIRLLRNKGDLVWICTGRPLKYAKKNFYQYANGYIVSNGRQGFTCCAKIYDKPLTKEQVQRISRTLDQIGAGYIFFEGNRGCYYGPDYGFAEMQKIWPADFLKKDVPVDTLIPYSFDVVFKDQEMKKKIEEELGDLCVLNPHGPHPSADVTVRGWDKGDGLKAVAEYMHVPLENTYAFGDGLNDLSMLEAAGHGIAMGNGQQALKDKADYVTTAIDEDGVYNGLKHFGLI